MNDNLLEGMTEEQLLKEFPEKPSKWKKILTLSIALFLIFLMISYAWVNYDLDDIIVSLLKSKTLEENKIEINETTSLTFKEKTYQTLLKNYLENQDKEFKACLLGIIKENNYEVTEIIIPEMIEQSFNQVISKSCPEKTIAELHSQPYRRCLESEQDLKTKELIDKPETLMIIMCEKDRFKTY
jgi:proteasome lid subunit RPN8/RPN11